MDILVLMKMVPDIVEELEITPDGNELDADLLRMRPNESDEHALEEALLLKERHGGKVTVLAPDAPELDDALYAALAKGADRVLKIPGPLECQSTSVLAQSIALSIAGDPGIMPLDLILTGTQAIDDLDGLLAPLLAHQLKLPYLGIVSQVNVDIPRRQVLATKEFPGAVRGEYLLPMPAVIGIQSAEKTPRYVPVAKIRAAMKSRQIETAGVPTLGDGGRPLATILMLAKPTVAASAVILDGMPEEAATKLCGILTERGLI